MTPSNKKEKIWLLAPHIGQDELLFVNEAFKSNWIAPLGPNLDAFENELSSFFHNYNVQAVNSGTSAIHLSMKALNIGKDDIVLCQSLTFAGSAFPILYEGATPVFIDSENETWNMDPNYLEDAINFYLKKGIKPKAILPVHLYGMPAKMNEIKLISEKYEIPIIEDAAEAMGSTYHKRKCGTLGDIGIVSFNGNKIITTSGGGAIITNSIELINKTKYLSNGARENVHYYLHNELGYNYRLSNILAGIGRGQLKSIEKKIEKKRLIFEIYKSQLSEIDGVNFLEEKENTFCNRWLTTLTFSRNILSSHSLENIKYHFDSKNIETRLLWNPMHLQPVFKHSKYFGGNISEVLFNSGFCLPSTTSLNIEEITKIADTLKELIYV